MAVCVADAEVTDEAEDGDGGHGGDAVQEAGPGKGAEVVEAVMIAGVGGDVAGGLESWVWIVWNCIKIIKISI